MEQLEITGINISKNPVTTKESFVITVRIGAWAEHPRRLPFRLGIGGNKSGIKD